MALCFKGIVYVWLDLKPGDSWADDILPGVVVQELGVRLSPFSSSKGFCGVKSCSPPVKNSASNQCLYSCSSTDRDVLWVRDRACRPNKKPSVRSVSNRGDDSVLVSVV